MSSIEKYMSKLKHQESDVPGHAGPQAGSKIAHGAKISEDGDSKQGEGKPVQYIDVGRLKSMGMITPESVGGRIVEEYRMIKRPLLQAAFNADLPNGNVIMMTSALPNEGKTYTAINLAMSIVMEMDYTVLLVDADLHRPSIATCMGLDPGQPGLRTYLLGEEQNLSNLIVRTNIPKLAILPSGQACAGSTELVSSHSMKFLMKNLSDRYPDRIIILDTPPLLSCNDAVVLSQLAGQTVVVVESGKTEQSAVKSALSQLDVTKPISVVLNKGLGGFGSDQGYYGYGGTSHY